MSRARVAALALVNWKGVFYERYLLDRHVTALEGANGAGKTTVMIAAYVVLLPDMTRLRFTNLGESGATGGDRGIWGRLGELGRPAYSALELALGDQRIVLGVRLTRASEPTVELTPFVIDGLAATVALRDLLGAPLGRRSRARTGRAQEPGRCGRRQHRGVSLVERLPLGAVRSRRDAAAVGLGVQRASGTICCARA